MTTQTEAQRLADELEDSATFEMELSFLPAELRSAAAELRRLEAEVQALRGAVPAVFLSDVMTAAGLVSHGKQCKALGDRLADAVMAILASAPKPAQGEKQ
jgi:hypothetical protein